MEWVENMNKQVFFEIYIDFKTRCCGRNSKNEIINLKKANDSLYNLFLNTREALKKIDINKFDNDDHWMLINTVNYLNEDLAIYLSNYAVPLLKWLEKGHSEAEEKKWEHYYEAIEELHKVCEKAFNIFVYKWQKTLFSSLG